MRIPRAASPLLYPAVLLSAASLAWTTWSLVDLLGAGWIGVTVAAGADVIWASVIVAEARGLRIAGRTWAVPALGWATLLVVAAFLAWHGADRGVLAMAVAGPFLPLGAKAVWTLALADMRDPAALTAEQEGEIHTVMRESEYAARLRAAERSRVEREADAEIDRIRAEARTVLARDEADFEISLERLEKQAQIQRRAPLALTMSGHPSDTRTDTPDKAPDTSGQADTAQDTQADIAPPTSPDTRPDKADALQKMIATASGPAELIRTLSAHGIPKNNLVSEAIRLRPDMLPDSIRRTVKRLGEGPYL